MDLREDNSEGIWFPIKMLKSIRNKFSRKINASETLEKYWELKYKDLESRHEALKSGSKLHKKKHLREHEYDNLKREMQDLRSALDEKTAENLSLRDNLASLNSLIAAKEFEKEVVAAKLKEAESLRKSVDALAVTMLEEVLLREEEIKAKFENTLRLKDVSIAILKDCHLSGAQRHTTEEKKAVSDLTEALSEAEGSK